MHTLSHYYLLFVVTMQLTVYMFLVVLSNKMFVEFKNLYIADNLRCSVN